MFGNLDGAVGGCGHDSVGLKASGQVAKRSSSRRTWMADSRCEPLLDVFAHEQAPPANPERGRHRLPRRNPVARAFFCDVQ